MEQQEKTSRIGNNVFRMLTTRSTMNCCLTWGWTMNRKPTRDLYWDIASGGLYCYYLCWHTSYQWPPVVLFCGQVVHGQYREGRSRRKGPYGNGFFAFILFQGNVAFETGPTLIANLFRQIYSSVFAKQAQNIMYRTLEKQNIIVLRNILNEKKITSRIITCMATGNWSAQKGMLSHTQRHILRHTHTMCILY